MPLEKYVILREVDWEANTSNGLAGMDLTQANEAAAALSPTQGAMLVLRVVPVTKYTTTFSVQAENLTPPTE